MKQVAYIVGGLVVLAGSLFFITSSDEAITNVPPKNETIVVFGDSLVAGVGAETSGGFVSILESRRGWEIHNLGVAGDTTADGLARLDEVLEYDPGIVLVLFGGNDALRKMPLEVTATNLANMIGRLQERGAAVVLIGVRGGLIGDPYDEMYETLSETFNTAYVPNVLSGILLRPKLTYDQLHPNDAGYVIVADRIEPVLASILNNSD